MLFKLLTQSWQIRYRLKACPELCAGLFIRKYKDPKYTGKGSVPDYDSDDEDHPDNAFGIHTVTSTEASEHLIAHILATKIHEDTVTDESMEIPDLDEHYRVKDIKTDKRGHRNDGRTIAIHAVVVDPEYQGCSIGTVLLKDYIQRMTTLHIADRISILVHKKIMPFYELQEFESLGPSEAQFSGGGWYNMTRQLSDSDDMDE